MDFWLICIIYTGWWKKFIENNFKILVKLKKKIWIRFFENYYLPGSPGSPNLTLKHEPTVCCETKTLARRTFVWTIFCSSKYINALARAVAASSKSSL